MKCSLHFVKLDLVISSVQMSKFPHTACNESNSENTPSKDAFKAKALNRCYWKRRFDDLQRRKTLWKRPNATCEACGQGRERSSGHVAWRFERWMWPLQGTSCWKRQSFTDFFSDDEADYPIGRHLLSFLSYLVGDSQAIHLTVQWAKWFSLAIKAWNSREPQSREREGSRRICMFSGDFGNHSWSSHVLICSPNGSSGHANCYNKTNDLHM